MLKYFNLSKTTSVKPFSDVFKVKSVYLYNKAFELAQVQLSSSAANYGPKQQKAAAASSRVQSQPPKESSGQAQQVWISSSGAHSPCQGNWQTLEMGSSSSPLCPQNNAKQGEHALQIITVFNSSRRNQVQK